MSSNSYNILSQQIKAEALRIGFSACGIAPANAVDENSCRHFTEWLSKEGHAGMQYMENHQEKRLDPCLLMENTRSIISVALNYYPSQKLNDAQYQFAWYAYGKDYHNVMKEKLNALYAFIRTLVPTNGRVFCDTAPVLERYWAQQAGLGWIGKHTQLILPRAGSCFFLGEIFLDIELAYDTPLKAQCGSCTRCLEACPTKALISPYYLNASKCLSYLTIEHRGNIPDKFASKMGNRIYGCDECQKVCPWNNYASPCTTPALYPTEELLHMQKDDWHNLTEEEYNALFKGSAVKRAKFQGLLRNIKATENNNTEK